MSCRAVNENYNPKVELLYINQEYGYNRMLVPFNLVNTQNITMIVR